MLSGNWRPQSMAKELSAKEKRMKETMEKALASPDMTWVGRGRKFFGLLPSDPRCTSCLSPFKGTGGRFVEIVFNKKRSQMNPLFCTSCEDSARRTHAGVETDMSMLFADIRGSTPLAERMSPFEFKRLIDRFYTETTHVLAHSYAVIDKLAGDEVSGFYLPGYIGKEYAKRSVEAAREILLVTGHAAAEGPWAPVGVGINTGEAYFGVVGEDDTLVEITALGDAVNVAARLASQAAEGEIVLSESTVRQAALDEWNNPKTDRMFFFIATSVKTAQGKC
jgi:adenylate cyclase